MKQTSTSGNPLNPGFASVIFSLVLIGLKVVGVLSIPWWLALLPVYFWFAMAVVIPVLVIMIMLGVVTIALPVVGAALAVGPLIEKFSRRKRPEIYRIITTLPADEPVTNTTDADDQTTP